MTADAQRLRVPLSLTDRATEALTLLVTGGEYAPRSRLPPELALAARFGVSRTVVREAVARLKSAGLVESRQGSGVFVREPNRQMRLQLDPRSLHGSAAAVLEIVEVRRGLEAEAAALAAARHTGAQLAELRAALAALAREEARGGDGVGPDMDFHRAIARASGNRHFSALWNFLAPYLRVAMGATRANEARRADLAADVHAEHRALLEAIARRDPAGARRAAIRHMDRAEARIRAADPGFWSEPLRAGPPRRTTPRGARRRAR